MITTEHLIEVYRNAVDIVPFDLEDNDSVFLGHVSITEPAPLHAMLVHYTGYIDNLLRTLPLTPTQYLSLITARAFTYDEYKMLWQVKAKGIQDCIICKVLLITTDKEVQLFTSVRESTHEAFVQFLEIYTKSNNPFLYNFLYEMYA